MPGQRYLLPSPTAPRMTTLPSALIMAGRRPEGDPLARAFALPHKALICLNGRPVISFVVRALRETGFSRILVAACEADIPLFRKLPDMGDVGFARAGATPLATAGDVLRERTGLFPLLVTTADHPLLSPPILREFLGMAGREQQAACVAALVRRRTADASLRPELVAGRTWYRLREDCCSGCNLFLLRDARALALAAFGRKLERNRKGPLFPVRIARAIGPLAFLAALFRRPGVRDVAALLEKRTGCPCAAVFLSHPEAAIDVDRPRDIDAVLSLLSAGEQSPPHRPVPER